MREEAAVISMSGLAQAASGPQAAGQMRPSLRAFAPMAAGSTPATAAPSGDSSTYAAFASGAKQQPGLFPVWHKGDKVYIELDASQLDRDFLETVTIGNGLGARTIVWGDTDYLPSQIVRFERRGDTIVVVWPNWYAVAPGNPSAQLANEYNFPDSVVGTGAIVASNGSKIVFDASSLLSDVMDVRNLVDGDRYAVAGIDDDVGDIVG